MLAVCILSLLVTSAAFPRVVVLTKNRLLSLMRLINSIDASRPLGSVINLHLCCDTSPTADPSVVEVHAYASRLQWSRGAYSYSIASSPGGLTKQWINCSRPTSDADRLVILWTMLMQHTAATKTRSGSRYNDKPTAFMAAVAVVC